jgi:hypothetical protein
MCFWKLRDAVLNLGKALYLAYDVIEIKLKSNNSVSETEIANYFRMEFSKEPELLTFDIQVCPPAFKKSRIL